ncbi:MAG: right-handed parallel beta-helix repeat-containing protein [Prevotella sp.]|nr:right-handed parallel beta-helix repeat-containing protein [Prevotella sp.]
MKRLFSTLLVAGLMLSATAQTHVDVSSAEQLLATIDSHRGASGNDTLYIHLAPGTYILDRSIVLTEKDSRPMVFEGDEHQKPVVSAGKRISGWQLTPEGWWKCYVPETAQYGWRFEQLYINGRRATRARTPDKGFYSVKNVKESVHVRGNGRTPLFASQTVHVDPSVLSPLKGLGKSQLEQVVARFYHKWDNTTKYLQYAEPDSGRFYITGRGMNSWNDIREGTQFYMENYRGALNAPGEWFLDDDGMLLYIPRPDEDINTAECFAPRLEQVMILKGTAEKPVTDKIFRNISFAHTANYTPRNGHEPSQVAAWLDAAIMMDHAQRICIDGCEVQHTGNYAIWMREQCYDNKVVNTFIHDIGGGGIKIGSTALPREGEDVTGRNLVENCILRHMGLTFPCSGGVIIFQSAHNKVLHNDICDLRYTGVSVGWVWGYSFSPSTDNEVGFNHIHHIGWGELSDMGAVYTLGISPGTRIHDNVVHDVWSYDYGGWGLYTDEGSTGIVMENNLVYNTKCGGFHQHYGRDNIIRNNIFAWAWLQQLQASRIEEHRSFAFEHNIVIMNRGTLMAGTWGKVDMDYNCYFDTSGRQPTFLQEDRASWQQKHDQHSVLTNPMFRDAAHYDFRLKSKKTAKRIGFKPFDYSRAGVYGSNEWKQKAQMEPELIEEFASLFR